MKWAVTTGRYMIILTEMVVIVAFLMRFKLDEDLRNLNEQINGQVALLQSQTNEEEKFRQLQKEILLADQMLKNRTHPVELFDYAEARIGEDITIKKRGVAPGELSITALTLSQRAMGELMSTISADPRWKMLDVTELAGEKTNGIKFTIVAKE